MHPGLRKTLAVVKIAEKIDELFLKHGVRTESMNGSTPECYAHIASPKVAGKLRCLSWYFHVQSPDIDCNIEVLYEFGPGATVEESIKVDFYQRDARVSWVENGPTVKPILQTLYDLIGKRFYHGEAISHEHGLQLVERLILRDTELRSESM